jgi:S-adenosylmethionine:tRNA ribosyltransferase-isomerase
VELHLSTQLAPDNWIVELRAIEGGKTAPLFDARPGERLQLDGGGSATLLRPHRSGGEASAGVRLWVASLTVPGAVHEYLERFGFPIRYGYVPERWPISYYQTVFAREVGSAEMPSASRGFTVEIVRRLESKGITIVPVLLHAGVASLEQHEPPHEEYFRVRPEEAVAINRARDAGGWVVAAGTSVVRAIESVSRSDGVVRGGEGWTRLVITPERGLFAVDALLTGLHEPRASHLAMLEALAGRKHLGTAYAEALREQYLWHEFGDLHLILPFHPRGATGA